MGALPTGPDAVAELLALLAPLLPQVARARGGTRVRRRGLGWGGGECRRGHGVASAPRRLAARGRTEALASGGDERPRADRASYRYGIVTPRALSHGCLLLPPWGP